jgi:uncharacterized protein (TIGR02145 family)
MQTKNRFFLLLTAAIALAACNEDETAQQKAGDPTREVTFAAYTQDDRQTRSLETTTDNILSFSTYGVYNGAVLSNLNPANVSRPNKETSWGYNPLQIWPNTGEIDFYAYSPTGARGLVPTIDANTQSIAYTVPAVGSQQNLLVAVNEGVDCVNRSVVRLTFQHALSRVQIKALSTDPGKSMTVYGVSFLNLKSKGTLALDDKIQTGFDYSTTPVLWTGHDIPTSYGFDFTAEPITVGNSETNVIIDDATNNALLVLPQETELGESHSKGQTGFAPNLTDFDDLADLTLLTDPADGKFYIKVLYASDADKAAGTVKAKYLAVTHPGTSDPITFEIGRSYTFVVKLSNDALGLALEEAYMPAPHKGWAGSNIYWDGTKLTFDDVDDDTNEQYQGLLFKWGSLIGISPVDDWNDNTTLYLPVNGNYVQTTVGAAVTNGYITGNTCDDITVVGRDFGTQPIAGMTDYRLSGFLTYLNSNPANIAAYHGDICAYLASVGSAPAGEWRMPTGAEFDPSSAYARVPSGSGDFTLGGASDQEDGTCSITNGYRLTYASSKTTYFPASGNRYMATGALYYFGTNGYYWSASPISSNNQGSWNLEFDGQGVNPSSATNRKEAYPVRCVKK